MAVFSPPSGARTPLSFVACATLFAFGFPAWAQSGAGAGSAEMAAVRVITAPRPLGLGGAYSALAEGADGIGINPSGLARESGAQYFGSFRRDLLNMGSVAYAWGGPDGRFAVSASYLDYGEIPTTSEQGWDLGVTRPFSLYPAVSYARAQGERWRWGATLKLAHESLGSYEGSKAAWGAAADAGIQYQPGARNVGFGASLTNLGRKFSGHFEGDDLGFLPAAAKAGLFYHPRGNRQLALALDAEMPFQGAPALALGAEYRVIAEWQIRAGTRWDVNDARNAFGWLNSSSGIEERYGEATKLAAGTTVRVGPVEVDYAAQWRRELGFVHSLGVSWAVSD